MLVKVLGGLLIAISPFAPRTSMSATDNLAITKPLKGTLALQGGEEVSERMLSNSSTRSK